MSLILNAVAKSFGDRQLFSAVSFRLNPGQKAALIGRNGSGKSTLLRIIAGQETPDEGSVQVSGRVTMLEQQARSRRRTVLEVVTPIDIYEAAERLAQTERQLRRPTTENLTLFADAEEHYKALGGYDFASRAQVVLAGLDLDPEQEFESLSGGEQRRTMLAALLLAPADLLLLDEPTNHLDVASLEWLEEWLVQTEAAVLIVSHDRTFLDNTVGRVLEIERGQVNEYAGNYSEAMERKELERRSQARAYSAQERKKQALRIEMGRLASMGRSAGKFNHKRAGNTSILLAKNKAESVSNTNASRAKALEARLERMNEIDRPFEDDLEVTIPLPEVPHGPEEVLVLKGFGIERDGRQLFRELDLTVRRGEKLALTGPNGSGKSSLLKAVLGQLPYEGTIRLGHDLSLFSAGQKGEELTHFDTIESAMRAAQPELRKQDLYHLLGRLGLPAPVRAISELSGGQLTRLALARLAVTRASLLLLDEPTNNLDLEAVEALEKLLVKYAGTILFASHDRRLVQWVATRLLPVDET